MARRRLLFKAAGGGCQFSDYKHMRSCILGCKTPQFVFHREWAALVADLFLKIDIFDHFHFHWFSSISGHMCPIQHPASTHITSFVTTAHVHQIFSTISLPRVSQVFQKICPIDVNEHK